MPKRRAICNTNAEIDDLIDDLLEINLLPNDKITVKKIAIKMRKLVKEAKEAGQAMEFRLFAYRGAIEKLGYIRDKDGKLADELAQLRSRVFELENLPNE
jgi:hypothetical protein